jgi:hypothetical protein
MTLKDIILAVKQSCIETNIKPSDDMILDTSVRIFNASNINLKGKESSSGKEVKEKIKPSEKMYYSLINYYGYTEKEVDEMDYQTAYDTIKKEKEIQNKEKKK